MERKLDMEGSERREGLLPLEERDDLLVGMVGKQSQARSGGGGDE